MPLDKTPAPFGALVAHKAIGFSPGVFSNGIFSSVLSPPSVLRTIASVQPDGAEEKGMRYAIVGLVMVTKVGVRFPFKAVRQWVRSPPPSPSP